MMDAMYSGYIKTIKEKRLYIPLLLELCFVILIRVVSLETRLYLYFVFYALLVLFFHEALSLKHFREGLRWSVRDRRITIATAVVMLLVFFFHEKLNAFLFLHISRSPGLVSVKTSTLPEYVLYAVTMSILMPLAEGMFFRKALVSFENRQLTAVTTVFGLLLAVLLYAISPVGVISLLIPLVPVTVCFLLTKNVYLSIIAHLFYCVPFYMEFAGYEMLRVLFRWMITD